MTYLEYQQIRAVSWSLLKEMRRSPLHYRYARDAARPDTRTLAFGRAVHCAVLEPERFSSQFAVYDGHRRGREWDQFRERYGHLTILSADEQRSVVEVASAVRSHPVAARYLHGISAEVPVTWTDRATGLRCKARLDGVGSAILDLKTARTAHPRQFAAAAARMGYHCQLAWYRQGWAEATGDVLPAVLLVAEKDPPYDVAVYSLDEDALYAGERECAELIARVAECERTNHWPGQMPDESPLELPGWVWGDDEEMTAEIMEEANG